MKLYLTVTLIQLCVACLTVESVDDQVEIGVYYEALCPDSQNFIKNQFWPTYQKVGRIFNTTFVPFGNANFSKNGDSWQFQCQHGPRECLGNTIQACALNHFLANETTPFINCVMSSSDPVNQSQSCAEDNELNWEIINDCTNGKEGNELLHQQGVATLDLIPKVTWVPWIIVNGVYTKDNENLAQSNFLKLVCDNYDGIDKPSDCNVTPDQEPTTPNTDNP